VSVLEHRDVGAVSVGQAADRRYRFSVDDYHRMAEAGVFRGHPRVELLEGDVFVMTPIGNRHAACVDRLTLLFCKAFGEIAQVRTQGPVRLSDSSEPEPDLLLLKPRADFYATAHPVASDVLLLVEVMDTSADYDRGKKLVLYAREGVGEVWLVDLNRELVEAYRRPVGEVYTENRVVPRGLSVAPGAFPEAVFRVDAILG
jgi:Uma2 family endonuclease